MARHPLFSHVKWSNLHIALVTGTIEGVPNKVLFQQYTVSVTFSSAHMRALVLEGGIFGVYKKIHPAAYCGI